MNRLIIIGASGHGKVVADIAKKNGYEDIVFLDNNSNIFSCLGYQVIGSAEMISELDGDVFIAIGNSEVRKKLMCQNSHRVFPILIHPNAVIADDVQIGEGSVIMAGTVINSGTRIGRGVIVNTCSSIDHDCRVGDYCHISVGAHLCGTVMVKDEVWVGAGATVINNININSKCLIGAGAVVVDDINEKGIFIGVPAKKKKDIADE